MPVSRRLIRASQEPFVSDDVLAWIVIAVVFVTGSALLWIPTAIAVGWF